MKLLHKVPAVIKLIKLDKGYETAGHCARHITACNQERRALSVPVVLPLDFPHQEKCLLNVLTIDLHTL